MKIASIAQSDNITISENILPTKTPDNLEANITIIEPNTIEEESYKIYLDFKNKINLLIWKEIWQKEEENKKMTKEIEKLKQQKNKVIVWWNDLYYMNLFTNTISNLIKKTDENDELLDEIEILQTIIEEWKINFPQFLSEIKNLFLELNKKDAQKQVRNKVEHFFDWLDNIDEKTLRWQLIVSRMILAAYRWDIPIDWELMNRIFGLIPIKDQRYILELRKEIKKTRLKNKKRPYNIDNNDDHDDDGGDEINTDWDADILFW